MPRGRAATRCRCSEMHDDSVSGVTRVLYRVLWSKRRPLDMMHIILTKWCTVSWMGNLRRIIQLHLNPAKGFGKPSNELHSFSELRSVTGGGQVVSIKINPEKLSVFVQPVIFPGWKYFNWCFPSHRHRHQRRPGRLPVAGVPHH